MNLKDYEKAETTNLDFKVDLEEKEPKSWLKSVSAFANTKGGVIIFGVEDGTHSIKGIENIDNVMEKISELISSRIQPLPRFELNCFKEKEKDLIVLNIGDGPMTPYYYVNKGTRTAFVRVGNQSQIAKEYILNNLILKGKNITYDALSSNYRLEDLSFTLLSATVKEKTGKAFNKERDYISLRLVNEDNNLTNGAVLLSDQGALKQSKIVCTRWSGLGKASGKENAIDDKEYEGSIISLLENADTFIKNNSKNSWKVEGMDRIEYEEYPINARREAIVNALIHRDYQIVGSEIHIDMYDDRLEIVSPGGMIDGTQIQNLDIGKVPSMRRNVIISDIFSRLHFMDRRGSGLSRIMESYNDCYKKPVFLSDESSFTVIFPKKIYNSVKDNNMERIQCTNIVSDEEFFMIKIYKNLEHKSRLKTIKCLKEMFSRFGYEREFSRDNVKDSFKVEKSRASEIIKLLKENDLIISTQNNLFKFKK
ncbi:MAG: ATP-binding protein [Clostridia bacterium]|nr:ATP-binding protein [Clostridia bacterium]